ncbi:SCP1.201-like deaminase [Actinokineospora alba]|uniref:SCP1.201-like deaminase n=1 Tax=Actinokineospora alba TaxID=504798 RepID=A0A1H0SPA1_9PSEU|nr:DddA-like double-stranded DNA deaminase toxin [Actinokineospora alba]TDP66610.1 nucleic acid/nucleotide deaminase of polymorphic system toxin [Actinokineospora alba]SDJ38854.1 SCP1.201-like deaminase [Actinokineospora alba]SDP43483.1 SCP1.201-like deaminase [Actinokineospora alba]
MSVAELGAALRKALADLPIALVNDAIRLLGESRAALDQAAHGSHAPELPGAVSQLQDAEEQLRQVLTVAVSVRGRVEKYLTDIGAGITSHSVTSSSVGTSSPALSPEKVAELGSALPPAVPKPNPTGRKTHGRWVDEAGRIHEAVSGRDGDSAEAWRILQEAEIPVPAEPVAVTHVEIKLAARMVRESRRHMEVVINNRPCPGRFGCDVLLPAILPEGYSMTVHGPGYRQTFTGGKKPWWR